MKKFAKLLLAVCSIIFVPWLSIGIMSGFVFDIRQYTPGMIEVSVMIHFLMIVVNVIALKEEF